jgi:hypothetical protein
MIINQILIGFVNGKTFEKYFTEYFYSKIGLKLKINKQEIFNVSVLINFYHEKHRMVQQELC